MKENIKKEFEKLNLIKKSKNYIENFVITDKDILESILNENIQNVDIDNVFKLITYGVELYNLELELVRYKLSYSVYLKGDWKANYYIFFDEEGEFIDDFFDI